MTQHHNPTPIPPDDPRDLLASYAVGATDPDESARVEAYLRDHPEAKAEVAEYAAAATLFSADVPLREPPAALRQKLLDSVRSQPPTRLSPKFVQPTASKPPVIPSAVPAGGSTKRTLFPAAAVAWFSTAAAVALLAMNIFWMSQVNDLRQRQAALEAENLAQQAQVASLERASQERLTDAVTIMVTGNKAELMDDEGESRAMVMWQPGNTEAVMFTHSLPVLDESRTYQLWLIDADGNPISAGTFTVDADGRATLLFNADAGIEAFDALGISVEPAGGSPAPTTQPLAVSAL